MSDPSFDMMYIYVDSSFSLSCYKHLVDVVHLYNFIMSISKNLLDPMLSTCNMLALLDLNDIYV